MYTHLWIIVLFNLKSAFIQHFIVAILVYCSVLSNIYYWKVPFFTTKIFNLVAAKSQVHTKGKYEYVTKTLVKRYFSAAHLSSLTVTSKIWSIHCSCISKKTELFYFQVVKLSPNSPYCTKNNISDDHTFDTLHLSERIHNFRLQLVYYWASFWKH